MTREKGISYYRWLGATSLISSKATIGQYISLHAFLGSSLSHTARESRL
jgi:hypothetical protein